MYMYNNYRAYPCPYYTNMPIFDPYNMYNDYGAFPYYYYVNALMNGLNSPNLHPNQHMHYADKWENSQSIELKDYGPKPFAFNIKQATKQNSNYRTALWTGENLQLTLMSIEVGEDIGLEVHHDHDQFIRIEEGQGFVKM